MRFGAPVYLYTLFLILPLIVFMIWGRRQRAQALQRFVAAGLDKRLVTDLSVRRRQWKDILLLAAVALSLFALARPQWGYHWEEVRRQGTDIVIAVDVSKSMLAGDISPSRLERARRKVEDLLNLLQGDRVALIAFSGRAFILTPLTLDYGAIRLFLDSLSPDLITSQGTDVGEAVALALQLLKQEKPESESLLLMSDGEDLSGDAEKAAKQASDRGVRIYALGIGTETGAPIPEPGGGFKKDASGQIVLTKRDDSVLEQLTKSTGGVYARSVVDDRDLQAIYDGIQGKLEKRELKSGRQKHFHERYQWFLALALLLLLVESLMSEKKSSGLLRRRVVGVFLAATLLLPGFGIRPAYALSFPGQLQEGERLYHEKKYEEALQKFLDAQIDHPDDPRIQYNLGNTYYQLERYDEAEKLFDAVAKSAAEQNVNIKQHSLYNLGNAQFKGQQLEDAIASYQEALKIDPHDEDAQFNLELAKRLLEQQKQQKQQQDQQSQQQNQQNQQQAQQNQAQQEPGEAKNRESSAQSGQTENESQGEGEKTESEAEREQQQENAAQPGQREEEKQGSTSQAQAGANQTQGKPSPSGEAPTGQMTREEAARWLSGLQEGKQRIISTGEESGKNHSEKDW